MKLHPKERSRSKEDYVEAIREFTHLISLIDNGKIDGILLYGSVARGDYTPGRSDIDIFMSLNYDVVTDPNLLMKIAQIVKDVTERRKVELNISLYDLAVMRDGRFFTLGTGMERHLLLRGKVLYKNDPRKNLKTIDWKHTAESEIAFSLRGIRKGLIDSLYYLEHDLKDFYQGCEKTLEQVSNLPRDVIDYRGWNREADSKLEIIDEVSDILDQTFLRKINDILGREWFDLIRKPKDLIQIQKECLNFYESAVKKLMKLPRPTIFKS